MDAAELYAARRANEDVDWLVAQLAVLALEPALRPETRALGADPTAQGWPAEFASTGTALHPASTERLMEYWSHGEGAAKVRWPEPCAFCRCLDHLAKYFPKDPKGLCANLERRATGHWPNPEHHRTHHCPC